MRKFIIAASVLLSITPLAAKEKLVAGASETQMSAMLTMMTVGALEAACPQWRVSPPAMAALMIRSNIKAADIAPGGRFETHMRVAGNMAGDNVLAVPREDRCATAQQGFGPRGIVEKDLMVKRE